MKTIELRRWTRSEYHKMIEAGLFAPEERVELVEGEILRMTPQASAHFTAIRPAEKAAARAFGAGFEVRAQAPLALTRDSEPQPDIAIVRGSPRDYAAAHPATALLLIEVSDTTLDYDRHSKAGLYAQAAIRDYWIVNLVDRCLEVYRKPGPHSYQSKQCFLPGDSLSPLAAPHADIAVSDILP